MKSLTALFIGAFLFLVGSGVIVKAQTSTPTPPPTVSDNVMRTLRRLNLDQSIKITSVHSNYLNAEPVVLPDGSQDLSLWNYIKKERSKPQSEWIHDNTVASKLKGNGTESYRQKTGPSMQVVFTFKGDKLLSMKIDYDDHAPRIDNLRETTLHVKEMVSHIVFRKHTGEAGVSRGLDRKFAKEDAASAAALKASASQTGVVTSTH